MNKNLPKVFLALVISSITVIGVSIGLNQAKFEIVDIEGDKANIGDVSLISQGYQSIYTSHQSILSKDGFNVKKYKPEMLIYRGNSEILQSDKKFFKNQYDENSVYKNNKNMGYIEYLNTDYAYSDRINFKFNIINKDIKSNKENVYNFEIEHKIKQESDFNQQYMITSYNDEVYLAFIGTANIKYDQNDNYRYGEDCFAEIYKVNLDSGKLEKINEISLDSKDSKKIINNQIQFVNNNKIYFEVQDNAKGTTIDNYIVYYDIAKNKFDYIKEPLDLGYTTLDLDYGTYSFSVDEDILNIVVNDKSNNDTMKIKQYSIDLKSNKVINKDNEYKVEQLYKETMLSQFRSIDNKLYLFIEDNNPKFNEIYKSSSVVVLDEKTKKVLYMGQYKEDNNSHSSHYILKNSEMK